MKVIVTGSLGNISLPLVKELIQKGHTVTVISSNTCRQHDIEALGAKAAIGSLEDVKFLAATFTGADALYAMVPTSFTDFDPRDTYRRIGHAYVQAIQQAGIPNVVYLSSIGADLPRGTGFILGAHDVENMLSKLSNIAITYLRPGYFYTNLYRFADMIKGAGFIGTNYGGDSRLVMAAPIDIASAAVAALEIAAPGIQVRYIVSSVCTANEAARIIGVAIGKPDLQWIAFSDEQMQHTLEERGMPSHIAANFVELGASMRSEILYRHYDLQKPAPLGKITLEDFAREFANMF